MVAITFWESFFLILLFLPLAMIWAFTLLDIFRRDDMGGGSKALWVACAILVPFLGTLVYLVTRPSVQERGIADSAHGSARDAASNGVAELAKLAELHDRGKLTDSEFAAEKARLLGAETATA